MNQWRDKSLTFDRRPIVQIDGSFFCYVSEHPKEERLVELTSDYRDENGDFIAPEAIAWDGVETNPGISFGEPGGFDLNGDEE